MRYVLHTFLKLGGISTKYPFLCANNLQWVHAVWKSQTSLISFNIASEASYGYVLLTKNAKNSQFGKFWKPEACGQTVLPDKKMLKMPN